jgi:hypothetical protein
MPAQPYHNPHAAANVARRVRVATPDLDPPRPAPGPPPPPVVYPTAYHAANAMKREFACVDLRVYVYTCMRRGVCV